MIEDEQSLVERAKSDPQAFGVLYDNYYDAILRYIFRRTTDQHVAEELTSDTFFKAMRALPKFTWKSVPFSAWLYKIANNEVNTYLRKQKRRYFSLDFLIDEQHVEFASDEDVAGDLINSEDALQAHEDFLLIKALLQELPLKYQEVLTLRYFEKKKIQEISHITGRKPSTIKSLLRRGTAKLVDRYRQRSKMQPSGPPLIIKGERDEVPL